MRIPHTICTNTYTAYKPSAETVGLVAEVDRVLKAEHEIWDTGLAPTLVSVCVKSLVDNFKENQVLSELPSEDRDLLYETLSPDLPLPLTVPLLTDDIYWQRCATNRWTSGNYAKEYDSSWKRLYLERHIQDYLETLQVADFVLKDVTDLMTLCSPYVRRLKLRQLQISKAEPLDEEGDECSVEEAPCEHINLEHVIASLTNLQELDLVFGLRDCGMDFSWTLFQFSIKDCNNLGHGLEHCTRLKKLRIHRSTLDDIRLITLLQYIARNTTLRVLDFSHCKITDVGAMALGKVLTIHPTLATINLCVNKIRSKGVEGLAYALAHSRSPVDSLNLRLNVIGDAGAIALSSALAHSTRPRELILAACGIKEDGAIKLGQALQQNTTLKHLDLSNNDLGDKGGEAMELGLQMNTTIQHLDLRKTNILAHYDLSVSEKIFRNQEMHKTDETPQSSSLEILP